MPKVSIIMPSYNHAAFIRYAIDSVLNQTFTDFELIISDDASTDGSQEIIRSYKDPRIKTIFHPKNIGLCRSYNIALEQAKGDYIAQLASDDAFLPEKLEKQVAVFESRPEIGAVFSHMQIIDVHSKWNPSDIEARKIEEIQNQTNRSHEKWLNHFFKRPWLSAPSQIVRAEAIKKQRGLDERFLQIQDLDLLQRLLISGTRFHIVEEVLVQYRRDNEHDSLSTSNQERMRRWAHELSMVLQNYLAIRTMAEFKAIFPEYASAADDDRLVPFYVAMAALAAIKELGYERSPHREFAINTLFNYFAMPEHIRLAEEKAGYSIKQFYELTSISGFGKYVIPSQHPVKLAIINVLKALPGNVYPKTRRLMCKLRKLRAKYGSGK